MSKDVQVDYVKAQENLQGWIESIGVYATEKLTEADTRSKLIDSLFIEVLGWDERQISREGYVNKIGFYDYILDSGVNRVVLEAKKTEVDFYMPTSKSIKYQSLKDNKTPLREAIEQGINYAATRSIDIVAVFNGNQLAITYLPFIHYQNYHDTYLFQNINEIRGRFIRFFNVLSPISNGEDALVRLLSTHAESALIRNRPPFKDKITNGQPDSNAKANENILAKYFEHIHGRYFSDIISDEELLKKCYCESEAAGKLERGIELVLRDRSPLIDFPIQEIETTKKSAGQFGNVFLENKNSTKLFLLLGGSGVGKTTFIFRYFNYLLSDEDKQFFVWLYLDFKKMDEEGREIDEFVYSELHEQLSEKYEHLELYTSPEKIKTIFQRDLKQEQGTIALLSTEEEKNRAVADVIRESKRDRRHHIKRIFEYLRSIGLGTCIIYDNVDQLATESQTRIFKHANVMRESLKTTIICTLREEVYYDHRKDPQLNYAEIERFHIPSPRLINVISKRIKVLKEETDEAEFFSITTQQGALVTLRKLDIIEVITKTFLGKTENLQLIEMLANNDLRDCLKYFKSIISSYNINYDDLVSSALKQASGHLDTRVIDSSQILRGLALQDRVHFIEGKTEPLINLFLAENDGFFSHFTKIRILMYSQSRLTTSLGHLPQGYFRVEEMYKEQFQSTVKNIGVFLDIIKKLQRVGALINSNGTLTEVIAEDYIRLGPAGKYYLDNLMFNPFYLSLVSTDTPIASESIYTRINRMYGQSFTDSEVIKKRRYLGMANAFVEYLIEEEKSEREHLDSLGVEVDSEFHQISEHIKICLDRFIETNGLKL